TLTRTSGPDWSRTTTVTGHFEGIASTPVARPMSGLVFTGPWETTFPSITMVVATPEKPSWRSTKTFASSFFSGFGGGSGATETTGGATPASITADAVGTATGAGGWAALQPTSTAKSTLIAGDVVGASP